MLKRILLTLVWVVMGLFVTIAIIAIGTYAISQQVPIRIPRGGVVHAEQWDRGQVSTEGTWTIEGTRQAFPLQFTKIVCLREDGYCTVAQAEIAFDMLNVALDFRRITKWDAGTLVFTDTPPLCVDYVYTISRANLRTIGTRTPKADANAHCKEMLEQRDMKLTLVDGFTVWQQLQADARAVFMPFVWVSVALWWVIVLLLIVRTWRKKPRQQTG
jgi:hypothetical protein